MNGPMSVVTDSPIDSSDAEVNRTFAQLKSRSTDHSSDKIDEILNKIDSNLGSIRTKKGQEGDRSSKGKTKKMDQKDHPPRDQSAFFDADDETEIKPSLGDRRRMSDGSDASSIEEQANAKFQQMMSKLDHEFVDVRLNVRTEDLTDLESIRTEELEAAFHGTLLGQDGAVQVTRQMSPLPQRPNQGSISSAESSGHDSSSVATESFYRQFQALVDPRAYIDRRGGRQKPTAKRFFPDGGEKQQKRGVDQSFLLDKILEAKLQEFTQHTYTKFNQMPNSCLQKEAGLLLSLQQKPDCLETCSEGKIDTESTMDRQWSSRSSTEGQGQTSGRHGQTTVPPPTHNSNSGRPLRRLSLSAGNSLQWQIQVDSKVYLKLNEKLNLLLLHIKRCTLEKQKLHKEIYSYQDLALRHKKEIREIERQFKESRVKAEESRSALMLLEFKRDSLEKHLRRLIEDVRERQENVRILENSGKKLQEIGFTAEEVTNIISEREELRERVRLLEAAFGERTSPEFDPKETIWNDQRQRKETLSALQRDLDAKLRTIEELRREKEEALHRLRQSEKKCQQIERERNDFVKVKGQELCLAEFQFRSELSHVTEDSAKIRQQLIAAEREIQSMRQENIRKEETQEQLRQHIEELKNEIEKENERRDNLTEENIRNLKAVILDKELALAAVRAEAEKHKYRHGDLQNTVSQHLKQIETLQEQMTDRDAQLKSLSERLRKQDTWYHGLLEEEKAKMEKEKQVELDGKFREVHHEMERTVRQLNEDLNHEKNQAQNYQKQTLTLREELEEMKYQYQHLDRAKAEVIGKMEALERDKDQQTALVKERHELEMQRSVDAFRESSQLQNDELERLRQELKELKEQDQEQNAETEAFVQKLVEELNKEQQVIAQLLQAPVNKTSNHTRRTSLRLNLKGSGLKSVLSASMGSFKAAVEELRTEYELMRIQTEKCENRMKTFENERFDEMESIKMNLESEKLQSVEVLKHRLVSTPPCLPGFYDVINMQKLNEQKMRLQEWEQKRSPKSQSSESGYGSPVRAVHTGILAMEDDPHTVTRPQNKMENLTLQCSNKFSGSEPNLALMAKRPSDEEAERERHLKVREMELSVRRAESKARMAEERVDRSERLLERKSRDHSKLQQTFSQQSKELMQMQKAYSELRRTCLSPTKSLT